MKTESTNTGKVKFFNETKGYGFIIDNDKPNKDYFFHVSKIIDPVRKDDKVSFDIEQGKKGECAVNIKLI